jgi:membrane protease YdiL (CAAX protease family)
MTEFIKQNSKPFGFLYAIIIIAISGVVSIIIGLLLKPLIVILPFINTWAIFISYSLSFGITLFVAKKWWQIKSFAFKRASTQVYLLILPMVVALSVIVESISSLIPMPEQIQRMFDQMIQLNLPGYLTIAIAAPILEELIFRGVILKRFLQNYSPTTAILLSATIFGIAHLNPWQFIGAFAIGILIGWIYLKTQSVLPGIFIHFANNSFSFFLAKKYHSINITFQDIVGSNISYISLLIICALICYTIYLILKKYFEKQVNITDFI